jgi:hypothetical protein
MDVERGMKLFEQLNARYAELLSLAETSGYDGDQFTRAAFIGFSQFSSTTNWTHEHVYFIAQRRVTDMEPAELTDDEKLLTSMCYGALMAQVFERGITELEFKLYEMHLAGYVFSRGGKIVI